jgi:SAM-dependent methyltransferase
MEPAEYQLMDAEEAGMWWYRALHARVLDVLRDVRGAVLDAGCGTGGLLGRLGDQPGLARIGLEWHAEATQRAAAKSGAPVARGSINALPFADALFDAAIAADVLCHRAVEPASALAELRRVLRPGGMLVVNMPAYEWLLSGHDRLVHNARRQSAPQLRAMLAQAGFADIRARYWNGLLLPLMVARRKIFPPRHDSASDVSRFSPWLNTTLHRVAEIERHLPVGLPVGGSVLATARRP